MFKRVDTIADKVAMPPGALVHVGPDRQDLPAVRVVVYDQDGVDEIGDPSDEQLKKLVHSGKVAWLQVDGVHHPETVGRMGEIFGLHPLVQEDILNTHHRPKTEEYDDYMFILLKNLAIDTESESLAFNQICLLLGRNWVISFCEEGCSVFEGVANRIRQGGGRIRRMGADYLAYTLLDGVVDLYFIVLEEFYRFTQALEEELDEHPDQEQLRQIHNLKRQARRMRRNVGPMREVVAGIERNESGLVREETLPFLRDVYDHTVQIMDATDSLRDMLAGLMELYLSLMSNRMNEIMKVLTIMATVFIPLTFIAGVYGMNFKFMPELEWRWGYPAALGLMAATALGLLTYFWKKKWL